MSDVSASSGLWPCPSRDEILRWRNFPCDHKFKRKAKDNFPYCKCEFLAWYGPGVGDTAWKEAPTCVCETPQPSACNCANKETTASPPATAPTNIAADEGVRRLASVFPPLEQ